MVDKLIAFRTMMLRVFEFIDTKWNPC